MDLLKRVPADICRDRLDEPCVRHLMRDDGCQIKTGLVGLVSCQRLVPDSYQAGSPERQARVVRNEDEVALAVRVGRAEGALVVAQRLLEHVRPARIRQTGDGWRQGIDRYWQRRALVLLADHGRP